MDKFCINHPEEKAVGTCGGCGALTCYRCSMNIDQSIYCSLDCFNRVSPPSAVQIPRVTATPRPGFHDEFSDMMESFAASPPLPSAPSQASPPPATLEEPSVILSSAQADSPRPPARGNTSRLAPPVPSALPGTRRSILSSSCIFHPDTSAVGRCSECRNPICTLCARETPGGLACSPSCGPTDLAGETERRKELLYSLALGAASLLVLGGAVFLIGPWSTSIANETPVHTALKAPAPERVRAPRVPSSPEPEPEKPRSNPPEPAHSPVPAPPPPPVSLRPVYTPPPPPPEPAAPEPSVVVQGIPPVAPQAPEPPRPEPRPATPRPPESPKLTPFESDLRWASALVRDASPKVREVLDQLTPEWTPGPDLYRPLSRLDKAVVKLRQAREIYLRLVPQAPQPELLQRHITSIDEILRAAQGGLERMGGVSQWDWQR